ncbi:MAG: hypothetical protein ACFFD8_05155 [Candidatus Thorarchaeota archaeon]
MNSTPEKPPILNAIDSRRILTIILQVSIAATYGGFLAWVLATTTDLSYISLGLAFPFPLNVYMVLLYAGVGLGIVFILNLFFRFTSVRPDRLFVSILLSPLLFLATLLVGHVILLFFLQGVPNLFLYSVFAFASLYFSMFAILFIILDMLPNWGKQVMVLWYGGSIGAFLGVSIPTLPLFILFLALAAIDIFTAQAVQPDWQERAEGMEMLGTMLGGTFMGVGDIVSYAAIVAHSLAYFNLFVSIASVIMLFVGAGALVLIYRRRIDKPIPGLIVVIFGVIPWIPAVLLQIFFP